MIFPFHCLHRVMFALKNDSAIGESVLNDSAGTSSVMFRGESVSNSNRCRLEKWDSRSTANLN
jgi:hypothetical protein